ncbi:MAG: ElyC/SanA/YdcF family protein [Bdellovibrionota bacterium]
MKLLFWKRHPAANTSAYRMSAIKRSLIGLLITAILGPLCFYYAGHFLVRNDSLSQKVDVLFLLMGDMLPRSNQAIKMINNKLADRIIFFRTLDLPINKAGIVENEGILTKRYLLAHGIPSAKITYIDGIEASSTYEEAKAFMQWVKKQKHRPNKILVVTSWYHSSRAGAVVEKMLEGMNTRIFVSAAYSQESNPDGWWRTEVGFLQVFNEYLKKVYYFFKY